MSGRSQSLLLNTRTASATPVKRHRSSAELSQAKRPTTLSARISGLNGHWPMRSGQRVNDDINLSYLCRSRRGKSNYPRRRIAGCGGRSPKQQVTNVLAARRFDPFWQRLDRGF